MNVTTTASAHGFLDELREQRWDDHRYYHRHRVNQALHLLSALCFLTAYALVPTRPIAAAIFGWVIAMWPRQIGHVWFEPREYDDVNQATFAHKEAIKVGFNLQRKAALFAAWLAIPALLRLSPSFFGLFAPYQDLDGYLNTLGILWIALAFVGLLGRSLYLAATRSVQTGAAWFTKILTDPFHDILMYWKSPYYLLKGETLDPMHDVAARR